MGIINLHNEKGQILSERKSLDDILNERELREKIVSTEEAEEITKQEQIWEHEAKVASKSSSSDEDLIRATTEKMPEGHVYAKYEEVDKEQLQKDLEEIKASLGPVGEEDFQHLLKLERWGRAATLSGFFMIFIITATVATTGLSTLAFWALAVLSAILIGVGNVARWADVTHPVLHGAYDKVPNIPRQYTKAGYARGTNRYFHWLDWIKPEAWEYEHNIMHHYHLGEDDDPDNVERNMQWLIQSKTPMFLRRIFVYIFAMTWKFTYYAPNTLRILENKERRKKKLPETDEYYVSPFTKNGRELWKNYYLPYAIVKFALL